MARSLSDLPPETVEVVSRWNPVAATGRRGVFVAGARRSGKSTLLGRLRALDSADCSAPGFVADPEEAGVVLMVFDAGAPLGREELSILDTIAHPARAVVFALTKIDLYRQWPTVRERNRVLLARHSIRFAESEIHPVSLGGLHGPGMQSGVEAVLEALISAATDETVLEQTRRMITATARSVRDTEPDAQLRAERTRLLAQRDGTKIERIALLRSRVQLSKVELTHEVASRIRGVGTTARAEIDRAGRIALSAYPERLSVLVGESGRSVGAAVAARLDDLWSDVTGREQGSTPGASLALPDAAVPDGPEPRHRGLEDRMAVLIGASAGLGLGRLVVSPLSIVPALEIAAIPLTLALGALAAWWLSRARGHIAERAHVRQWVTESLVHIRSQWEQFVIGTLLAAEAQLSELIVAESRTRAREVDERVAQLDAELRQLVARRQGQLSACERDLAALDRGLLEFRRGSDSGEPAGPAPLSGLDR